jgi:hypothetical protein
LSLTSSKEELTPKISIGVTSPSWGSAAHVKAHRPARTVRSSSRTVSTGISNWSVSSSLISPSRAFTWLGIGPSLGFMNFGDHYRSAFSSSERSGFGTLVIFVPFRRVLTNSVRKRKRFSEMSSWLGGSEALSNRLRIVCETSVIHAFTCSAPWTFSCQDGNATLL